MAPPQIIEKTSWIGSASLEAAWFCPASGGVIEQNAPLGPAVDKQSASAIINTSIILSNKREEECLTQ